MTPDEFRREYVEPAVELWRHNQTVTHLAANAIAQLDALAEVVWLAQGSPGKYPDGFRNDLGNREPAIEVIRQACNSHKHGALRRKDPTISGERPRATKRAGFFLNHSFVGGPLTVYEVLVIRKTDGSDLDVTTIVFEAMDAWRRQFARLGYGQDWLILGYQF